MPLPPDNEAASDQFEQARTRRLTMAGFIEHNRVELLARCRIKVIERSAPSPPPPMVWPGVPHFLQQLVDILDSERLGSVDSAQRSTPSAAQIGPAAAQHGAALLQQGFSVDQVVHEYGDVCQAVTELALAQDTPFSTDEFRILNRCLDNAIAGAVAAHQSTAQQSLAAEQAALHGRLRMLIHDHQRLVGIARHSFLAIKAGQVGMGGATGTLLGHALDELTHLSEERLPHVVDALRRAAA